MRGERDEVRLDLVSPLECQPRFVLLLEESDAIERKTCKRTDRLEESQLFAPEERCVRRGPDGQRTRGHLDHEELCVAGVCGLRLAFRNTVRPDHLSIVVPDAERSGA